MGDDKVTQGTAMTQDTLTTQISPDTVYWIWFQLVFGIGTLRAETMMKYFEHPKEIFDGVVSKNSTGAALTESELAIAETAMLRAAEIKRRTISKGVDIITPDNSDYPELLRQIYSKPAVLYVKGDLSCLRGKLAIAMVGSRKHTEYGKEAAAWLAKGLVQGDAVVVSGLAHGIDTECHMSALTEGGKSIGILGCGIDIDYPKGNAKVKRLMCENGAVVTEFPLGTEPRACNFPIRNRIIAGICHGVVVVEADTNSGSLLTARHAFEEGRDIFAVPGSIFSIREQGTHRLIQDGAKLVNNAQDVFDEYKHLGFWKNVAEEYKHDDGGATSYSTKSPMKNDAKENLVQSTDKLTKQPKKQKPNDDLSEDARSVYSVINESLVNIDYIADNTDITVAKILSALTELEICGLIQGYPGRKFGIISL